MKKPEQKDYGWEDTNHSLGEEGGWCLEGGEEAYFDALAEWDLEQSVVDYEQKQKNKAQ